MGPVRVECTPDNMDAEGQPVGVYDAGGRENDSDETGCNEDREEEEDEDENGENNKEGEE